MYMMLYVKFKYVVIEAIIGNVNVMPPLITPSNIPRPNPHSIQHPQKVPILPPKELYAQL